MAKKTEIPKYAPLADLCAAVMENLNLGLAPNQRQKMIQNIHDMITNPCYMEDGRTQMAGCLFDEDLRHALLNEEQRGMLDGLMNMARIQWDKLQSCPEGNKFVVSLQAEFNPMEDPEMKIENLEEIFNGDLSNTEDEHDNDEEEA